MFFLPQSLATLPAPANAANPWFWPIGPLAMRFVGSALIASLLHWNLFADHPITSIIFVAVYILGAVLGFYPYLRYALKIGNDR